MQKDQVIKIEFDHSPGWVHRYFVLDTKPDGWVRLMHYGKIRITPHTKEQLVAYMTRFQLNQSKLAEALGVSRSTVSRYLNSTEDIPDQVYERLGIPSLMSEGQREQKTEELLQQCTELRGVLESFIQFLKKEDR